VSYVSARKPEREGYEVPRCPTCASRLRREGDQLICPNCQFSEESKRNKHLYFGGGR